MKSAFLSLILVLALSGWTKDSASLSSDKPRLAPVGPPQDLKELASSNTDFAFDLYHAIADGEDNILYSPYSLSQALAMVYASARGQAAQEIGFELNIANTHRQL